MKQTYTAYFSKKSSSVRIDLRVIFESYDEMSDSVRAEFADGEANDEVNKITLWHTQHCEFNYLYMLGDLLDCDDPFEYFKNLFTATSENSSYFFTYQLSNAKTDYKKYIEHNNFSMDFFDIFSNSKRIKLNRTLVEVVNNRFVPLRIDSDTDNIFYCYESTDIKDIIFATIHFALENGYKLIKCKHCERWFFTPTLKEAFCKRTSPCFDMIVNNKKVLGQEQPCRIAVDTIKKRLQDRKKAIYDKWKNGKFECGYKCENCPYSDCIIDDERCQTLCNNYKKLKKNIINSPTVKNIVKLHRYLYSDDMPKQERPNRRKSNAFMRGIIGK